MLFGIALNPTAEAGRDDAAVVHEHIALGDLAEPLGFNSLFVLEHHFSGYVMSPAPFQMLAFYAGRTQRIHLGTAVVVLPWHDPIKVAEQIALLDIMCHGRCLFAFGRGRGEAEFRSFRVPINESRERFIEATEIIVGALTNETFSYQGRFHTIPELSIRPKPVSGPQQRLYGAAMGQESSEMVARLGLGMLTSTQKAWPILAADVTHFRGVASNSGHNPRPPIVLTSVSVSESRDEARERALQYLDREWTILDTHYHFSEGRLSTIQGYESYASTQQHFRQLASRSFRDQATAEYMNLQLVGTPDDCIQQIEELSQLLGFEHLVLEFSFGGMPCREAERNMRLFASEVLPVMQRHKARLH